MRGGGGRQSETDSVACKAGAKTTTAAQQRCSGMHTPLAPEYRVLPLPAPPPPAHCHPDQGWWSHARCGRRPRRRGEGAVDWGPCMQATLTCSTGGCCPNPRFACVPLNPAPITMTSWWERKQGVCGGGGRVCGCVEGATWCGRVRTGPPHLSVHTTTQHSMAAATNPRKHAGGQGPRHVPAGLGPHFEAMIPGWPVSCPSPTLERPTAWGLRSTA